MTPELTDTTSFKERTMPLLPRLLQHSTDMLIVMYATGMHVHRSPGTTVVTYLGENCRT